MPRQSLESPRLIRRPALPGLPKGWHSKITLYPWKIPEKFRPRGHRVGSPPPLVVHVYDDPKALYKACRKLEKTWIRHPGSEEILGSVVPTPWLRRGRLAKKKPFAEMFLLRAGLSSEVISHECVHAAAAYLRALRGARGKGWALSLGVCGGFAPEERLAYLTGQFAGALQELLVKHGVWSGRP